jgi:hypothetical protein
MVDGKLTDLPPHGVIRPEGPGRFRITTFPGGPVGLGIWKREGREIAICFTWLPQPRPEQYHPGDNDLYILRPAAPRKR